MATSLYDFPIGARVRVVGGPYRGDWAAAGVGRGTVTGYEDEEHDPVVCGETCSRVRVDCETPDGELVQNLGFRPHQLVLEEGGDTREGQEESVGERGHRDHAGSHVHQGVGDAARVAAR